MPRTIELARRIALKRRTQPVRSRYGWSRTWPRTRIADSRAELANAIGEGRNLLLPLRTQAVRRLDTAGDGRKPRLWHRDIDLERLRVYRPQAQARLLAGR